MSALIGVVKGKTLESSNRKRELLRCLATVKSFFYRKNIKSS